VNSLTTRYRRIVLKLSGTSLADERTALSATRMAEVADSIRAITSDEVAVTVIVGGGNILRTGRTDLRGITRVQADTAGMAATGVNALILQSFLEDAGVRTEILSRGPCTGIGVPYSRDRLRHSLDHGEVGILAGGMGVSGFSTDVPAVHAAVDSGADVVIMSKHGTDGVYDSDPCTNPEAVFLPSLTVSQAIDLKLGVMDSSALTLARSFRMTIHVVAASDPRNTQYAVEGKEIGSLIHPC
jgi:uridylate kinase